MPDGQLARWDGFNEADCEHGRTDCKHHQTQPKPRAPTLSARPGSEGSLPGGCHIRRGSTLSIIRNASIGLVFHFQILSRRVGAPILRLARVETPLAFPFAQLSPSDARMRNDS